MSKIRVWTGKTGAPEITVPVDSWQVPGAHDGSTKHGGLTDREKVLTSNFFANLIDMTHLYKAFVHK
jgi:catalase (peroxidase I)